ncbi:MAG: hypothetical protein U0M42_07795 [Acutalibacteraceae bacterium]|nr:hypothetical protein [Acutalibacteraceae bacterium]
MKQGLFLGINKKAFEYLLKNADDCIITNLENDENVSLEIKLIINVPQEKC